MCLYKVCGVHFPSPSGVVRLLQLPSIILSVPPFTNIHHLQFTIDEYSYFDEMSGWTIRGKLFVDGDCWVEDFVATHIFYGTVEGNIKTEVKVTSESAWNNFLLYFPYTDYCADM